MLTKEDLGRLLEYTVWANHRVMRVAATLAPDDFKRDLGSSHGGVRGTLTHTSVYPREVVKCALKHNAAAVIFAHNHPSGVAEPSHADEILTRSLKAALALVDIQVLDHFIVAGSRTMSFAERGLL